MDVQIVRSLITVLAFVQSELSKKLWDASLSDSGAGTLSGEPRCKGH
jgi:hypothetical protein